MRFKGNTYSLGISLKRNDYAIVVIYTNLFISIHFKNSSISLTHAIYSLYLSFLVGVVAKAAPKKKDDPHNHDVAPGTTK